MFLYNKIGIRSQFRREEWASCQFTKGWLRHPKVKGASADKSQPLTCTSLRAKGRHLSPRGRERKISDTPALQHFLLARLCIALLSVLVSVDPSGTGSPHHLPSDHSTKLRFRNATVRTGPLKVTRGNTEHHTQVPLQIWATLLH